jgi:hypothetical protein
MIDCFLTLLPLLFLHMTHHLHERDAEVGRVSKNVSASRVSLLSQKTCREYQQDKQNRHTSLHADSICSRLFSLLLPRQPPFSITKTGHRCPASYGFVSRRTTPIRQEQSPPAKSLWNTASAGLRSSEQGRDPAPHRSLFVLLCTLSSGPVAASARLPWPWHTRWQVITGAVLALLRLDGFVVHVHVVLDRRHVFMA